jgi:hypothetical protein
MTTGKQGVSARVPCTGQNLDTYDSSQFRHTVLFGFGS